MKWEDRGGSSNVLVSGGKAVGGGIGSIIIGLILWLVFGMNPMTAMQTGSAITGGNSSGQQTLDQQTADRDQKFASVVLKDTEEVWGQIFSENNMQYQQPKLVLFNGMVRSGCGNASSATGPFYCPADQRVYLDTSFFQEMRQKLGITGDQNGSGDAQNQGKAGDFAQAYVIAHKRWVIMCKINWVLAKKWMKPVAVPLKHKPTTYQCVKSYKRTVSPVFGQTVTNNVFNS